MPNPSNRKNNHLDDAGAQERSDSSRFLSPSDRRAFLQGAAATAAAAAATLALPTLACSAAVVSDMDAIHPEIEKRHDESLKRLQHYIRQPSMPAENRAMYAA